MNNKLLNTIVGVIAMLSLSGIAVAEPADSDVDPLFNTPINEQETNIPSEYILSEMYTVVSAKSPSKNTEREHSVENRTNKSPTQADNFEWIPTDWYSAY